MRLLLVVLFLFFSTSSFAGWVDDVGILERPTSPTAKPNMGIMWVDKLTKDLMFLDSDGLTYNILLGGGIGGAKLNDLADVDTYTASPTIGQSLLFDGTTWKPGNSSSTLAGLADVDLVTVPPTSNKVLGYDGSKWVPATGGKNLYATGPISLTQDTTSATFSFAGIPLGSITDVDLVTTPPTSGVVLGYNGTKWVPSIGGKNLVAGTGITITQDATTATISSSGKTIVGSNPVVVTQDSTTATFSIQNMTASGTQTNFTGDVQSASCVYYGSSTVDGSYRDCSSGSALIRSKRISGSWSEVYRVE